MLNPNRSDFLKTQYHKLQKQLNNRAQLVAVSKTFPVEDIVSLYQLGQRDFGENRLQELSEKAEALKELAIRWHFIGHLQSNKVKSLFELPGLYAIHSLDSLKLLKELFKYQERLKDKPLKLFFQVNTSKEKEKHGLNDLSEVKKLAQYFKEQDQSSFKLTGLMTLSRLRTEHFEQDARACFAQLRSWRDQLDPQLELSMGMSSDYLWALEEGANWLRVGSALFGSR